MLIQNITYNTIIEQVKNWIKTNCINISNYNSLPACFKPNYIIKQRYAGNNTANMTYEVRINKSISQVSASQVDTDFINFINQIKLNDKINTNIQSSELLNFVNNISSFCSTKVAFTISQYSKNKYIIYDTSNFNYQGSVNILTANALKIIDHVDMLSILNILENIINRTSRTIPCTYSYNIY